MEQDTTSHTAKTRPVRYYLLLIRELRVGDLTDEGEVHTIRCANIDVLGKAAKAATDQWVWPNPDSMRPVVERRIEGFEAVY